MHTCLVPWGCSKNVNMALLILGFFWWGYVSLYLDKTVEVGDRKLVGEGDRVGLGQDPGLIRTCLGVLTHNTSEYGKVDFKWEGTVIVSFLFCFTSRDPICLCKKTLFNFTFIVCSLL